MAIFARNWPVADGSSGIAAVSTASAGHTTHAAEDVLCLNRTNNACRLRLSGLTVLHWLCVLCMVQVAKNLDNILDRSLKVKPVGAGGSAARRR